jgi:hypothetical protein
MLRSNNVPNSHSIRFISLTPVEHEAYITHPAIREAVDKVGNMLTDLYTDDDVSIDILLAFNDSDVQDEFTLAFGGSTLSLEFSPEFIEVCDFNDGDEEVLQIFDRSQINAATTWLVNQIQPE